MAIASQPIPGPDDVRTPRQLLDRLAELRAWAGQPSLRTLRRLAGTTVSPSGDHVDALPTSTISYVLNGRGLPRPPRLEFVEAFVTACLRACDHPADRIPTVVEQWRTSWRVIAMPGGDAEPAGPAEPAHTPATPVSQSASPAPPPARPARSGTLWTGWLRARRVSMATAFGCTALGVAAGAAGAVALTPAGAGGAPKGGPGIASPAGPARVLGEIHRGTVTLKDVQGFDIDRGMLLRQREPGIDLSPWGAGNHLVTKSHSVFLPLGGPGPENHRRCTERPASDLVEEVRGLYAWAPGQAICVWSAERNLALLTLRRTPSPADPVVAFRYVVWRLAAS